MPITCQLTACPNCDLLLTLPKLRPRHSVLCPRCDTLLQRHCTNSPLKTLAFALSGLFLFIPAIWLPLLRLDAFGFSDSTSLIESIIHLFEAHYYLVGMLTAFFAALIPMTTLLIAGIVSLHLHQQHIRSYTTALFRYYIYLEEWAMLEVYLLGILIAIIKMFHIASIDYLAGFFCCIGLTLCVAALGAILDKAYFWREIDRLREDERNIEVEEGRVTKAKNNFEEVIQKKQVAQIVEKGVATTASEQKLLLCMCCQKLLPDSLENSSCPRCGTVLHRRKPNSISRTWSLILAATLLLFPANLLPIMEVNFLGVAKRSTIFDGILYFFTTKSYFVGIVIFTASIFVPICKVLGLSVLLLSRHLASNSLLRRKTRLYRIIVFIGRWSMLDIFVIALLAAAVDFGFVSTTEAAPAATWFCIVVPITMFAAHCFDPRIIWDRARKE